jgi:hypothetical protein
MNGETDGELFDWLAHGFPGVPQKPVDWHPDGPERVTVNGILSLKHHGLAHDQFLRRWAIPADRLRLEKLGFEKVRPNGRWHVIFTQPIDSEAHAYFPQPNPEIDREPPSTMEAITDFMVPDREYAVSGIVDALVGKGFEPERIAEQVEKLVAEKWLKRLPDGRVLNPIPY